MLWGNILSASRQGRQECPPTALQFGGGSDDFNPRWAPAMKPALLLDEAGRGLRSARPHAIAAGHTKGRLRGNRPAAANSSRATAPSFPQPLSTPPNPRFPADLLWSPSREARRFGVYLTIAIPDQKGQPCPDNTGDAERIRREQCAEDCTTSENHSTKERTTYYGPAIFDVAGSGIDEINSRFDLGRLIFAAGGFVPISSSPSDHLPTHRQSGRMPHPEQAADSVTTEEYSP